MVVANYCAKSSSVQHTVRIFQGFESTIRIIINRVPTNTWKPGKMKNERIFSSQEKVRKFKNYIK